MTGIFNNSIPGHDTLSPNETLRAAADLGADAVLFGNLLRSFPTLDPEALAATRDAATELGMTVNAGIGTFNPAQPHHCDALAAIGQGDVTAGLERVIRALPHLGAKTLFFVVGMIEDRDDPTVPWPAQIQGVIDAVNHLKPVLDATGIQLLIKTHEEISSHEVLHIIDSVGPAYLGIAHDPVNVVCRLEDPLACTRRIAPYVAQIHIDDAYTIFDGDLMRRYLAPIGTGDIDWPALLALVPNATRWIEFHRGQFAMPVFDPAWVAAQPDATLPEFSQLLANTQKHTRAQTPTPDQADVYTRLAPTIAWLKSAGEMA